MELLCTSGLFLNRLYIHLLCYGRGCVETHFWHLYPPICVISMPYSENVAHYVFLIRYESHTNCGIHLPESKSQTHVREVTVYILKFLYKRQEV